MKKLIIYKGFGKPFLEKVNGGKWLSPFSLDDKLDAIFLSDSSNKRTLKKCLLEWFDSSENVCITYEEFCFLINDIIDFKKDCEIKVDLVVNNIYPDFYPIKLNLPDNVLDSYFSDSTLNPEFSSAINNVYSYIDDINSDIYAVYKNYEEDYPSLVDNKILYFKNDIKIDSSGNEDYTYFIKGDNADYIDNISKIISSKAKVVGIKYSESKSSIAILNALKAFCLLNDIKLVKTSILPNKQRHLKDELKNLMKETFGYETFRDLKFYSNPSESNTVVNVSQGDLMSEMAEEAEKAFKNYSNDGYNITSPWNDIFITSSTGAGKSLIFQLPAIYLGKKHGCLTIVVEPIKALMKDQIEILRRAGYQKADALNSDLTPSDKERVLKNVSEGKIDILYLSPETLLAYHPIDKIIGDRQIGLMIIDESHIVTAWGQGFRPDYWYLGSYIQQLRRGSSKRGIGTKKVYHFPLCAFTATATYGESGTAIEIENSLMMNVTPEHEHFGYSKRDNIEIQVNVKNKSRQIDAEYKKDKAADLIAAVESNQSNHEKMIVYFPIAKDINSIKLGHHPFEDIDKYSDDIGAYYGRNAMNDPNFVDIKTADFESFRDGKKHIMFATKAFGMGVDVNDVNCVYHYAISGGLIDYVQEIGRAARKLPKGYARTDYYSNDFSSMNKLFGMSAIRDWQLNKVIEEIYATYRARGNKQKFLISPESFTYIFNYKANDRDECINKLKTCLLMLEKDFIERDGYPVLLSRPQAIFTKAFVCVDRLHEKEVLTSKYSKFFKKIAEGRKNDVNGYTDVGDIYEIDLAALWEEEYDNLSFAQFKYFFFTPKDQQKRNDNEKLVVMEEIRDYFFPRTLVKIESKNNATLSEIFTRLRTDLKEIVTLLQTNFPLKKQFNANDMANIFIKKFGKKHGRNLANSILTILDPTQASVKRTEDKYSFANTSLFKFAEAALCKTELCKFVRLTNSNKAYTYISTYSTMNSNNKMSVANQFSFNRLLEPDYDAVLKFMSIMDYITYSFEGGREPQIFIRLNNPNKLKDIIEERMNPPYRNRYVIEALNRHNDDIMILSHFFTSNYSNAQRWQFIEDYFLGKDVKEIYMSSSNRSEADFSMKNFIDEINSYIAPKTIENLDVFLKKKTIKEIVDSKVNLPEFLTTVFLTTIYPQNERINIQSMDDAIFSWPTKNIAVFSDDAKDETIELFKNHGWLAYKESSVDWDKIIKKVGKLNGNNISKK